VLVSPSPFQFECCQSTPISLSGVAALMISADRLRSWQGGNNNTYCHDSPLNWFNWTQAEEDASGFARFFRLLVNLRCALVPHSRPSPSHPFPSVSAADFQMVVI